MRVRPLTTALLAAPMAMALSCSPASPSVGRDAAPPSSVTTVASAIPSSVATAPPTDAGSPTDAGPQADAAAEDPMRNHLETREELLALFSIRRPPKRDSNADGFLLKSFGTTSAKLINQGNKANAKHGISRQQCLEGLSSVTVQTDEQRKTCGFDNMVPIYRHGKKEKAKACIDVFEFPNKACELPLVWVAPVQAKVICELQGKRLCSQEEWILACRGDPEGDDEWKYAYGNEMDLAVCNTNKSGATWDKDCNADTASTTWKTCSTNSEPVGSFPRCRSRFGVFDQHGNVAEIMTRRDPDGHLYSQLKGSAFFYVDVARRPDERPPKGRETYPDHCAYDARWHVEPINEAWHVNYHLGFRCCTSLKH